MANPKSTPAQSERFVTHSLKDVLDLEDMVQTKARQLRALLCCTYGNAGDPFFQMSRERQDEYLWACADMAEDIVASLDKISELAMSEVRHG